MTRDIRLVEGKIFTVDFSLLLNIALCLPSVLYPACTVSPMSELLFRFDMDTEGKLSRPKPGDIIDPIGVSNPANI
jgi:hypothetical protein